MGWVGVRRKGWVGLGKRDRRRRLTRRLEAGLPRDDLHSNTMPAWKHRRNPGADQPMIYRNISHLGWINYSDLLRTAYPKCQVECLQDVLSGLPTGVDYWGLRDWVAHWWSS